MKVPKISEWVDDDGIAAIPTKIILGTEVQIGYWIRRFDDGLDSLSPRRGGMFHQVKSIHNAIGRTFVIRGVDDKRIPGYEHGMARYARVEVVICPGTM
jgi:hypothetical protein